MAHRDDLELSILWETPHELVLVKPAGMATELTSDPNGVSLISRIRTTFPDAKLPHRLDRVTRGLVVVARTDEAIVWHNQQIRRGEWEKTYLARVSAEANPDRLLGVHTLHLRTVRGRAEVVRSGGKQVVTEILAWAVAPDSESEAHVLIRLLTGRFHQIRATMAHLGAPLVDDWLYGTSPGREHERFYLEHAALRFRPHGAATASIVHWRGDPEREPIA
ncbi:hypothetical protein KJ567_03865, partial [Candidatus Bipolaricaulota bacterium]|nr:hypothetical protein [Candidatus Bipolaricaulota bacterium]